MKLIYCMIIIVATCCCTASAMKGSTPNLKEIFLGRCYQYLDFNNFKLLQGITCTSLWQEFSRVFVNHEPCQIHTSQYGRFLFEASSPVPANQVLLWSGNYDFISSYSQTVKNYLPIAKTLIGFMLDRLTWCGRFKDTPDSDGINYYSCNNSFDCSDRNFRQFWAMASTKFAQSASGIVTVMLTSDNSFPAFSNESIFSTDELPNLSPDKVTLVKIIVVHGLNDKANQTDRCGSGSIEKLQGLLTQYNLSWECQDNPKSVLHYLCTMNPNHSQCQLATGNISPPVHDKTNTAGLVAGIVVEGVLLFLALIILSVVIWKNRSGNSMFSSGRGASPLVNSNLE